MSIKYNGQIIAGNYKTQIIKDADTINSGIIRIATQEEINTGTSNTTAVTPFYLTDGLNNKQDKLTAGEGIKIEDSVISTESTKILTDNQTIVQNDDNTITSIGIKTKSDTIMINWEGTNAEYEAGLADGTISPDWYCYITDDDETVNLAEYSKTDLSNLSEEGEKHFLNKTQITNCLLEVPQRIKYTLEDGILTIKAGSVVIVPYGTEDKTSEFPIGSTFLNDKFQVYDTQFVNGKFFVWAKFLVDLISPHSATDNWNGYIWAHLKKESVSIGRQSISGTSVTEVGHYYHTTENFVYDSGTTNDVSSFPLMYVSSSSTAITSVNRVFNGFGYVGSTVWQDKDIKYLIPNGKNEDGTLRNIYATTDKISITNHAQTLTDTFKYFVNQYEFVGYYRVDLVYYVDSLEDAPAPVTGLWQMVYVTSENLWYVSNNGADYTLTQQCPANTLKWQNGTIISYEHINALQLAKDADVQQRVKKSGDTMTGPLISNMNSNSQYSVSNVIITDLDKSYMTSNKENTIYFDLGSITFSDLTNTFVARTEANFYADGAHAIGFSIRKNGTESIYTTLLAGFRSNGTPYSVAPTPSSTSNTNEIATTAWVKALPRLVETWESDWFTSPGSSKNISFNLAATGMNATNAPKIFIEMIGKVVTAVSNYTVGDIVYPQFTNYNGSTGGKEDGQSVFFSGSTLTYAQGNSDSWVGTGANGGHGTLRVSNVQIKIILRRFS